MKFFAGKITRNFVLQNSPSKGYFWQYFVIFTYAKFFSCIILMFNFARCKTKISQNLAKENVFCPFIYAKYRRYKISQNIYCEINVYLTYKFQHI
jgi:hypothetical protein